MQQATHFLATDLDGTFVGDADALKDLLAHYEAAPYDVSLIYITGRHVQSARSLIESEGLPKPDILVTDIGTGMYEGPDLQPNAEWEARMAEHWQPGKVKQMASQFNGLQEQDIPDTRRVSYYADSLDTVQAFEYALRDAGIPHKLVYSTGRDLDVLPASGGKGAALQYIIDRDRLHEANILVAGDSGNDRDMLTLGYPAVVVGNGHADLGNLDTSHTIYRAQAHCAGGILEAWEHFYPKHVAQKNH